MAFNFALLSWLEFSKSTNTLMLRDNNTEDGTF